MKILRSSFPCGLEKLQKRRRELKEALREAQIPERLEYRIRLKILKAWMEVM